MIWPDQRQMRCMISKRMRIIAEEAVYGHNFSKVDGYTNLNEGR